MSYQWQLQHFRAAYAELKQRVYSVVLGPQAGNPTDLLRVRALAVDLRAAAARHLNVIPMDEYVILQDSIERIVFDLDDVWHESQSIDPPLSAAPHVTLQLQHFRAAYQALTQRVYAILDAQADDDAVLLQVRTLALDLRDAAARYRDVFSADEYLTLEDSIERMVFDLDDAGHEPEFIDQPEPPVIQDVKSGRRGRPWKLIDRDFLEHALQTESPAHVARLLNCSSRTVRREALRYGLVAPGARSVLRTVIHEDGTTSRIRTYVSAPSEDLGVWNC
ncbi:hypothetical protein L226DRAFT_385429 [Lentinus tigrinus ALCF2SS1-7]|uniref:Uncharacterized protein n=1 Tax=Lentinus tigrinus ALCF2SS1-6 TaxID=1328759 RepID=A0A5C2SLB3_9APHY|nr:hypothetical protein L227DRAFT_331501 [Lentinus tigrinus ALCF2SS1-6]RPD67958.1 hypothetical protein L226DRAFT_385429 [Lentinus tigrinus ALCF2SS1-7]